MPQKLELGIYPSVMIHLLRTQIQNQIHSPGKDMVRMNQYDSVSLEIFSEE